jgi:hypothetical protein
MVLGFVEILVHAVAHHEAPPLFHAGTAFVIPIRTYFRLVNGVLVEGYDIDTLWAEP